MRTRWSLWSFAVTDACRSQTGQNGAMSGLARTLPAHLRSGCPGPQDEVPRRACWPKEKIPIPAICLSMYRIWPKSQEYMWAD